MSQEVISPAESVASEDASAVPDNYQYWRDHGEDWHEEYDVRKRRQLYYHIQELMLAEYVELARPNSILEYGCGIGRHLKNLTGIPGLPVYGYDQSPSMVEGIKKWTTDDWVKNHVTLGAPFGGTPYEDRRFDVVYTSEVLVHVRPEDLDKVLLELIRIANWHVFHFEPSPDFQVTYSEHSGCWKHDLAAAYKRLGYDCEAYSVGFYSQKLFRVMLDKSRLPPSFSEVRVNILQNMENSIQPTIDVLAHEREAFRGELLAVTEKEISTNQELTEKKNALIRALEDKELERLSFDRAFKVQSELYAQSQVDCSSLKRELEQTQFQCQSEKLQKEQAFHDIDQILKSGVYRYSLRLAQTPLGGVVRKAGRIILPRKTQSSAIDHVSTVQVREAFEDNGWRDDVRAVFAKIPKGSVVSLGHPSWLGIKSSATNLFEHCVFLDDTATDEMVREFVGAIVEREIRVLVIQGLPLRYELLIRTLKKISPDLKIAVIWHGTFVQLRDDYVWMAFRLLLKLYDEGMVSKIGFVKKDMDKVIRSRGVNAGFLLNTYEKVPVGASDVVGAVRGIGIWNISDLPFKPAYETLAACSILKNIKLFGSFASDRVKEVADLFGLVHEFSGAVVSQNDMPEKLAGMHVNSYVTFNDCAPMLPLESLAVGVPCIIGPSSNYFDDYHYLNDMLVVRSADNAYQIGEKLEGALENRAKIIEAYKIYAREQKVVATELVKKFVEM